MGLDVFKAASEAKRSPETIRRWARDNLFESNQLSGRLDIDEASFHAYVKTLERVYVEKPTKGVFGFFKNLFGLKELVAIQKSYSTIGELVRGHLIPPPWVSIFRQGI